MTLRIGSHPNNLSLFILRHRGVLESALATTGGVSWVDYLHDGDSASLLAEGRVDVVATGATLPAIAAGNGLDVAYLAASPEQSAHCALLAMKEGACSSLNDLRGARIACIQGAFSDRFIARLLLQLGLRLQDVTLVDLNGSDSARALREGRVDLWAAIDPWLTAAQDAKKIRCLAQADEAIANRSLFWCHGYWLQQHGALAEQLLEVLIANDSWIARHPRQAAELLHQHLPGTVSSAQSLTAIGARPWGIQRISDALLTGQQQQADDLLAAGFITRPLAIAAAAVQEPL